MRYPFFVGILCCVAFSACQPQPASPPAGKKEAVMLTDKELQLIRQGRSVEKGGDLRGAEDLYKQAIAQSNGSIEAHLALSRLYLENNELQFAEETLADAKRIKPLDSEVNLRLGKIRIGQGRPQEAIALFEEGLKDKPRQPDLLNARGVALDMLGRHEEAQSTYRSALQLDEKVTPLVKNNLAMSYIMAGSYERAIELLEAVEGMEGAPVMRQNLALAYGLKGDMEKAREWAGRDLSDEQIKQNIAFYQNYRKVWLERNQPPSDVEPAAGGKE